MPQFQERLFSTQRAMPRTKPMSEMGVSGTPVWGGFVQQREKAPEWVGHSKWRTMSDIAVNVSIVAASIHYFLNLLARPRWTVTPADDSSQAQELADFMEDILHDMNMPLSRIVRRSAAYRFYGFSVQEWTAKRRPDGALGYESVEARPQHTIERWSMTLSGEVDGVWQRSPQSGALLGLPRNKVVYLVEDTLTDSPEGIGIFRHLGEPYNRLKQYLNLEARAFERDLRGIPIGRIPITQINEAVEQGNLKKEEAIKMVNQMEDFVKLQVKDSNTGMVLDSQPYESTAQDGPKVSNVMQWGLELLQGSANGLTELNTAIDRLQREMARIMGTELLMMGDQGGNRALATDKSRNLYMTADSVLGTIVDSYQRDLIDPIWRLNDLPEELKPELGAESVAFKEIEEITTALKDMSQAGAVLSPTDPVIDDVREILGVSPQEVPEEIEAPQPTPQQTDDEAEDNLDEDQEDQDNPPDDNQIQNRYTNGKTSARPFMKTKRRKIRVKVFKQAA